MIELVWGGGMLVQIALQSLFTRLDGLQLAVPEDELQWSPANKDIGLKHLPVQWSN